MLCMMKEVSTVEDMHHTTAQVEGMIVEVQLMGVLMMNTAVMRQANTALITTIIMTLITMITMALTTALNMTHTKKYSIPGGAEHRFLSI